MVIWGAEFDETGVASYIYYVDNNYGDQDFGGAECIRQAISYKEDSMMGLKDQTFMGGNRITAVDLIDLRQDIWKRAFPEVQIEE